MANLDLKSPASPQYEESLICRDEVNERLMFPCLSAFIGPSRFINSLKMPNGNFIQKVFTCSNAFMYLALLGNTIPEKYTKRLAVLSFFKLN